MVISVTDKARPDASTFQGLILALQEYWSEQGCVIVQPLDMEVGAGTFHPATFLRAIGPERPFLDNFNNSHDAQLVSIGQSILMRMGLYSNKYRSLQELPNNASAAHQLS